MRPSRRSCGGCRAIEIELPKDATPLLKYASLLFSRPAFR